MGSLKKSGFHYWKARNNLIFKPQERASDPEQLLCGISVEAQLGTSRCGMTESTPTRFRQGSLLVNKGNIGSKTI
jgi:hypothetical protein